MSQEGKAQCAPPLAVPSSYDASQFRGGLDCKSFHSFSFAWSLTKVHQMVATASPLVLPSAECRVHTEDEAVCASLSRAGGDVPSSTHCNHHSPLSSKYNCCVEVDRMVMLTRALLPPPTVAIHVSDPVWGPLTPLQNIAIDVLCVCSQAEAACRSVGSPV